jgi:hypothetical protein
MATLLRRVGLALRCAAAAGLPLLAPGCVHCPEGDVIEANRQITFDVRHQAAGLTLAGQGSTGPSELAIAFGRATVVSPPPAPPGDLVLDGDAVGCHADAAGQRVCDRNVEVRLIVHDVGPAPASIDLDDQRADLEVRVATMLVATGPCPGKEELGGKCPTDEDRAKVVDSGTVSYQGIRGRFDIERLELDCDHVVSTCGLQARGTFSVTATAPDGALIELSSGTFSAADQRHAQPEIVCNQ